MSPVRITNTSLCFVREPLKTPFGFKGRYLSELWQSVSCIETEDHCAAAPGTISVLWSDARVFCAHTSEKSSALMNSVTQEALNMLRGETLLRPDIMIDGIFLQLKKYADRICGVSVAETFVLNSLVGIDYALWTLWAKHNGITSFDGLIPDYAKKALSHRHKTLAHIPLVSYGVGDEEIKTLLARGSGLLKIKIGHGTASPSSKEDDMRSMLEWDKSRLEQIHCLARDIETPLTVDGKAHYYLDANGRYDSPARLEELFDFADKIGALEYIEICEEPFDPSDESDVTQLPVVINADESAHSVEDVKKRMSQGYRAVALKPIAKTMSVSFAMAAEVEKKHGSCLCADLTVVPLLAEWNKQFAARIGSLKGLTCGAIEINGHQNYENWEQLGKMLPAGMEFDKNPCGGLLLDSDFYQKSGVLFEPNGYTKMFQ